MLDLLFGREGTKTGVRTDVGYKTTHINILFDLRSYTKGSI